MGLFSESLIDPETNDLLRNAQYWVYYSDGSTLATVYSDEAQSIEVPQPLLTSSVGNATFYTAGNYYKLSRGGETVDIQVQADPTGGASVVEELQHANSISFDEPGCYFYYAYMSVNPLGDDYTLPTPWPSGVIYTYAGSDDITLTFPAERVAQGAQFLIVNKGSGSVTVAAESPASILNASSHTKVEGPGAVGLVIQTSEVEEPFALIYVLTGTTSA